MGQLGEVLCVRCKNKIMPLPNANVLLKNHLDKDVQKMFYPFTVLLTLSFSAKYSIKNNIITTTKRKICVLKILSIFFVIGGTVDRIYRKDIIRFANDGNTTTMLFLDFIIPVTRCLGYLINFLLNVVYRYKNIYLLLLIQTIHKNIDFSKNIRSFITWNWILPLSIVLINLFCFIVFGASYNYFNLYKCLVELIFISFDIDFVYAIRIIILLSMYLERWIQNVRLMNGGEENDKIYNKRLVETYQCILKAYDVYKTLFQVMVSL